MKRIHIILSILFLFLLTSCGAEINYTVDVNTKEESIQIDILLNIDSSDYEYINGGREKLILIINKEKPQELDFEIDESNKDQYRFSLSFDNYDDYLTKYEAITGETSASTFDIQSFSQESPFLELQDIELNDDLSHLLDWLKDSLINSGAIANEHSNQLINSENYKYIFNEENNYSQNSYNFKSYIEFLQINTFLNIYKENLADLTLEFIIPTDKSEIFKENFFAYLKTKDEDIKYKDELITFNEQECVKYSIEINQLNLNDENTSIRLNNIFGNGFCELYSHSYEENTLTKYNIYQTLYLNFDMRFLFDKQVIEPTNITIDIDGVKPQTEDSQEFPIEIDLVENGTLQREIYTTYSKLKLPVVIIIIISILALIVLLLKIGLKNIYQKLSKNAKQIYRILYTIFHKYLFEDQFNIQENIIEGRNFIIDISNISKVNYGRRNIDLTHLGINISGFIASFYIYQYEYKTFAIILFVGMIIYSLFNLVKYSTPVLFIELTSGRLYAFVFEDDIQGHKNYLTLLKNIEKLENKLLEKDKSK